MADESRHTDLDRRLDEIARRLDDAPALFQQVIGQALGQVVGRREYEVGERLHEHRFGEIERDMDDVRRTHREDTDLLHRRISEDRTRRSADWRQFLYAGLAPFGIGIALVLLTAWMSKGGH